MIQLANGNTLSKAELRNAVAQTIHRNHTVGSGEAPCWLCRLDAKCVVEQLALMGAITSLLSAAVGG